MNRQYSDYIIYVDESGDHSLESINKDYPIFVLAFCIFEKEKYLQSAVKKLKDFKFKHFGHDMVVLHENEIRRDKGWFKNLNSKELKETFLNELTSITTHIIVEQRGKKEDDELELEFRRICHRQNYQNINFAFEIIMANKMTNSAGLQLADLVARPIGLHVLKPQQENRAYKILKKKFHNKNGSYNGVGLKIFP